MPSRQCAPYAVVGRPTEADASSRSGDAAVPAGLCGCGARVGGRAGGCGLGRGVGGGGKDAVSGDRLRHQPSQRHSVDDRREDKEKDPADIPVGPVPFGVAVTPDGKAAFVTDASGTVSTIDVKTRKKDPADIAVGPDPVDVAVTPDGKTALVTNYGPFTSFSEAVDALRELPPGIVGTVSMIDVKTRTKNPADISVGALPVHVAVTPDGKTAFVTSLGSGTVSTIDVKTGTKEPDDIPVGPFPSDAVVTPDGKTVFVTDFGPFTSLNEPTPGSFGTVSAIDVKPRTKEPTDIDVGSGRVGPEIRPDR